jgi:hypothetical protein
MIFSPYARFQRDDPGSVSPQPPAGAVNQADELASPMSELLGDQAGLVADSLHVRSRCLDARLQLNHASVGHRLGRGLRLCEQALPDLAVALPQYRELCPRVPRAVA